ncbi:MAG: hypothetical protein JRI40_10650 [Deltaproteobacteria bacterium]|nr:hypothetical protein [Deltaproteobacteria bacterium]
MEQQAIGEGITSQHSRDPYECLPIMRWPGKIDAGGISNEIVHMVDVLPTLARIAGAEVPKD